MALGTVVASLSALPSAPRPPPAGHTGVGSSPARVPGQGEAWKEGHHKVTGLSPELSKPISVPVVCRHVRHHH